VGRRGDRFARPGLCAGVGIALNARRIASDYRTYVLLGDGEIAEGSVWEAADVGAYYKLDSLCAFTDVNGLGQSGPTQFAHDMDTLASRWRAFGWHTLVVDGHDLSAVLDALDEARRTKGKPTMILARTIKGKGVSIFEGKEGWHGKPLKKGEELDKALAELQSQLLPDEEPVAPPQGRRAASHVQRRPTSVWARRRTSSGKPWRRAKRTVPHSRVSATPTIGSSRSTPTSRTRRSARSSCTSIPIASTRRSSPSR
jgi:transketolase